MTAEQTQLTSQKKSPMFTTLAIIAGIGTITSAVLVLFGNKFSGQFIIPALLLTILFLGISKKRGEYSSPKNTSLGRLAILFIILAILVMVFFFGYIFWSIFRSGIRLA